MGIGENIVFLRHKTGAHQPPAALVRFSHHVDHRRAGIVHHLFVIHVDAWGFDLVVFLVPFKRGDYRRQPGFVEHRRDMRWKTFGSIRNQRVHRRQHRGAAQHLTKRTRGTCD
ncbi:MAG: hypothetical protein KH142_06805, partial [Slackia piriformis]|nr:hypothetical protein [Slackia piriformis]